MLELISGGAWTLLVLLLGYFLGRLSLTPPPEEIDPDGGLPR